MPDYHVYAYRRHIFLKALKWMRRQGLTRHLDKMQRELIRIRQDVGRGVLTWKRYPSRPSKLPKKVIHRAKKRKA